MIINFLRKIRSELLDEKKKLEEVQNETQMKIDEKKIIIRKLKAEEERSFDAFSPRRQNVELREAIFHLEEEQKEIMAFYEELKDQLRKLNSRLQEVNSILEDAKQQKMDLARLLTEQSKNIDLNWISDLYSDFTENLTDLQHKAEFCFKLIEIDPVRCKYELSAIVKELKIMVAQCSEIGENKNEANDCR